MSINPKIIHNLEVLAALTPGQLLTVTDDASIEPCKANVYNRIFIKQHPQDERLIRVIKWVFSEPVFQLVREGKIDKKLILEATKHLRSHLKEHKQEKLLELFEKTIPRFLSESKFDEVRESFEMVHHEPAAAAAADFATFDCPELVLDMTSFEKSLEGSIFYSFGDHLKYSEFFSKDFERASNPTLNGKVLSGSLEQALQEIASILKAADREDLFPLVTALLSQTSMGHLMRIHEQQFRDFQCSTLQERGQGGVGERHYDLIVDPARGKVDVRISFEGKLLNLSDPMSRPGKFQISGHFDLNSHMIESRAQYSSK